MAEAAMAEWSGDSGVEEEEGEEEPLFADDLEDLPPLPPPMPSLSQLQAKSNVSGDDTQTDSAAVTGNQVTGNQGPPQKKRKPLLTLTMDRLFSDKGLPYVEAEFPKLKFKGKHHEVADLKHLLQQYEHWANRMYPKFTFKDVTLRVERLSTTREFKMQLTGMRRRHARGGVASPPLVDCDSDQDEQPMQQTSDHTSIDAAPRGDTGGRQESSNHTLDSTEGSEFGLDVDVEMDDPLLLSPLNQSPNSPPSNHAPDSPPSNHAPDSPPSNHSPVSPPSNHSPDSPPSNHAPDSPPSNHSPDSPPSNHAPDSPPSNHSPSPPSNHSPDSHPSNHTPDSPHLDHTPDIPSS